MNPPKIAGMAARKSGQIVNVMKEGRLFPPPAEFAAKARIGSLAEYERMWEEAAADPEGFWGRLAGELHWFKPYEKVLRWNEPLAEWFVGGQTNVSYNCLDAHLADRGEQIALIWEGEPGEVRRFTYRQLHAEVCRFANVLRRLGVGKGDVAAIYMPPVPELAIAMLACARIGAVHSRGRQRIFRGRGRRPQQRRRREAPDHGRRRLAARQATAVERQRRRGAGPLAERREVRRPAADRRAGRDAAGPRLLVARADGRRLRGLPRRAPGQRNAPVHPLHQRLDRQAEGR